MTLELTIKLLTNLEVTNFTRNSDYDINIYICNPSPKLCGQFRTVNFKLISRKGLLNFLIKKGGKHVLKNFQS